MNTPDTTTEAHADTRPSGAEDLPDYAPIPRPAIGPALNEQGYYVGRVEQNLYWVTDGTYQSAFLTTKDGVVLLDALAANLQRAAVPEGLLRCGSCGVVIPQQQLPGLLVPAARAAFVEPR